MAETLLGPHREVVCRDCGHRFVCDADVPRVSPWAVCPNCGYAENDLESLPDLAGDRVLVDKAIFRVRPPRRWEVIAFRDPQRPDASGRQTSRRPARRKHPNPRRRRLHRRPDRAKALFDPTGDGRAGSRCGEHTPARTTRRSLDGERTDRKSPGARSPGVLPTRRLPEAESIDWLAYNHVCRIGGQDRPCPVSDVHGYNQSTPRRVEDTHDVTDLLLSLPRRPGVGAGGTCGPGNGRGGAVRSRDPARAAAVRGATPRLPEPDCRGRGRDRAPGRWGSRSRFSTGNCASRWTAVRWSRSPTTRRTRSGGRAPDRFRSGRGDWGSRSTG